MKLSEIFLFLELGFLASQAAMPEQPVAEDCQTCDGGQRRRLFPRLGQRQQYVEPAEEVPARDLKLPLPKAEPDVKPAEKSTLRFEVYKDRNNDWRWRLLAANNRIVAVSGEGYKNKADCLSGLKLMQDESRGAPTAEK